MSGLVARLLGGWLEWGVEKTGWVGEVFFFLW